MPLAGRWLALGPIPPPIVVDAAAACARGYPIGYQLTMTHGYSSFFVSDPSPPIRNSVEAISSVPNASQVDFEFTISFGVDFCVFAAAASLRLQAFQLYLTLSTLSSRC